MLLLIITSSTASVKDSLLSVAEDSTGFARGNALRLLSSKVRYEDKMLSLKYADSAINIFKELDSNKYLARAYLNKGHTYRYTDEYDKALKYYNKALKISTDYSIKSEELNTYNSIGNLYNELDQDSLSLLYYTKSYDNAVSLKDSVGISNAVNNIGILNWKKSKLDSSLKYIEQSFEIDSIIGRKNSLPQSTNNLGILYTELKEYEKAKSYFNLSIKFARELNAQRELANSYLNRADYYNSVGKTESSISDLKMAISIAKDIDFKYNLSESYRLLSDIYSSNGQHKKALEYLKSHTAIKDSLNKKETASKIAAIQKEITVREKNKRIEDLSENNKLQRTYIVLLIITTIAIVIIGLLYRRYYKENEKLNFSLNKKNHELKSMQENRRKFYTLLSHDLKSPVTHIVNMTKLLNQYSDKMDEKERKESITQINSSANNLFTLIENILEWAKSTNPDINSVKDEFNVEKTIEKSIDILEPNASQKSITINSEVQNKIIKSDEELISIAIRNLLSNSIKYSNENSEIIVEGALSDNYYSITIKDEGMGINKDLLEKIEKGEQIISVPGTNNEKGTGLGLLITRNLLTKIGGKVKIKTEENKGTEVEISIPL